MTENSHTAIAWEMLSSVVVLRAKARENKLPKLLSSLHGVEVELARIIAGSDVPNTHPKEASLGVQNKRMHGSTLMASRVGTLTGPDGLELDMSLAPRVRQGRRPAAPQADTKLRAYCKRYRALARQLRDLVRRGEAVASSGFGNGTYGDDIESMSDPLLSEQHDLSLTISRIKATTFEGLTDKATVLDDLVEEGSDDPVQLLARSLSRDITAMAQNGAPAQSAV
ncbi:hypothetical protein ACO2I3_10270 [Leptospira interrogans]